MTTPAMPRRRIGLLGTGVVGETLGTTLVSLSFQVLMTLTDPGPSNAGPVLRSGRGTDIGQDCDRARVAFPGLRVRMGSRETSNPKAGAWAQRAGNGASSGTFRPAAEFGEIVINATLGRASLTVLTSAGAENLNGKV
jgi:hypothetical protein